MLSHARLGIDDGEPRQHEGAAQTGFDARLAHRQHRVAGDLGAGSRGGGNGDEGQRRRAERAARAQAASAKIPSCAQATPGATRWAAERAQSTITVVSAGMWISGRTSRMPIAIKAMAPTLTKAER